MSRQVDPIQLLESLADVEVPALPESAVDRIESNLFRAGIGTESTPPSTHGMGRRRARRPLGSALALAAAAAAVLVALIISDPGMPDLELAGAEQVVLEMPDGSRVVGSSGDQLPDGTVITVGADGWALIGDTRLTPGDVVQIRDGRVVVLRERPAQDGATAPTSEVSPTTAVSPPKGDVSVSTRPAPDRGGDTQVRPSQPPTTRATRRTETTATTATPPGARSRVEQVPQQPVRQPEPSQPPTAPATTASTAPPVPRTSTTTTERAPTR